MSLVGNERTKLIAAALNTTGVAIIVTALIAPSVSLLYGFSHVAQESYWWAVGLAWFGTGIGLHVAALAVLGRLME